MAGVSTPGARHVHPPMHPRLAAAVARGRAQSADTTLVTTPTIPRDIERQREIERATDAHAYRAAYEAAYANHGGRLADRDPERARCADAKAHREATLRVVGLSRDFELLRVLDDRVYEACRG